MKRKSSAFFGIISRFSTFFKSMLWLGILMPVALFAQEKSTGSVERDSTGKLNQLKEVQIKSLKISRRQTSATPLQILSGEELQKLNSLSVADAVRFFSGVQLKDYGGVGGLKTINVRSMGSNHTAVFYDGVQLGNAQNGQVDLGKFSLDNIEEIELYNGQKSTIFQSARGFASGSSLYLKTKRPDFSDGNTQKLSASVKGGSFGLINPAILLQSKISARISTSISAEYKNADGRFRFRSRNGVYDTTAVREDADIETKRLELGIYGMMADSSKWNLKFYGYKDEQGIPGAVVNNVWRFSQRQWNQNFFAQGHFEKEIGFYSLMLAAKYANDYKRYLNPDIITTDGFLESKYYEQESYFSLANKVKINSNWDVVLSADYQINDLNSNLYRFAYPTRSVLLTALATQFHSSRFDIQANLLKTFVKDDVKSGPALKDQNEITPSVMLSWQPFDSKEFRLRSFYKHIFRMPTLMDLYFTFYGNRAIEPEYTKQYDFGFTYIKGYDNQTLNQISVQSDIYFNEVENKIVAIPGNSGIWSVQNLGLVGIKGLDVNVQSAWQFTNKVNLTAGLTYTYQQAIDIERTSTTYRDRIPYTPVHSGSFLASASYERLSMNYSFIYVGERYNQSTNNVFNYVQPWYTHDIAFHYNHLIFTKNFRLTAEINNLLNQDYDVVTNYPMPGRNYRFTLAFNY